MWGGSDHPGVSRRGGHDDPLAGGPWGTALSVVHPLCSLLPAPTTPKPKWPQTSGSCLSISVLSWTVLTPHYFVTLQRCVFQFVQFYLFLRAHVDQGSLVHGSQSRGLLIISFLVFYFHLFICVLATPHVIPDQGMSPCPLQWKYRFCWEVLISCVLNLKCRFCTGVELPRWLSGKESACQCRRQGFHLWVGKIPWRSKWQPTPVFLPWKSHGQGCLVGYSP